MEKRSFWRFVFSKEFLKQLWYALAVFFGIILIVSFYLRIFTMHNRTIDVPDFKSLTFKEAQKLAEKKHIRCQVIDSLFVQQIKPGIIIDQIPKAGFKVKRNRRILLVINAINPEKVKMPNLVGVSLRQALAILESNGLSIGILKYVPDIANNNVLNQRYKGNNIKPDDDVIKDSRIDLILGKTGNDNSTIVPNLSGFSLQDAIRTLAESSLNTGSVIYDNSVVNQSDSLKAKVYRQIPSASEDKYKTMGSFVDLWLTIDESKITKKLSDKNDK
jgi:beta-lactam-binding protein with PASTA domain